MGEKKREPRLITRTLQITKRDWQGFVALAAVVGAIIALIIAVIKSDTELGLEALKVVATAVPSLVLAAIALYSKIAKKD